MSETECGDKLFNQLQIECQLTEPCHVQLVYTDSEINSLRLEAMKKKADATQWKLKAERWQETRG